MKNDFIALAKAKKTVFSLTDMAQYLGADRQKLGLRVSYASRHGTLYRIRQGLYAMGTDYDRWEMATQILTPSYISLESALLRYGMIYQTISHITLISYKTCHLMVDDTLLDIHMVKRSILLCSQGISHDGTTSIASPERAFLDTLYLYRDFAFDHLDMIDWSRVDELLPLYDSLILIQRIRQYRQKLIAHNYA